MYDDFLDKGKLHVLVHISTVIAFSCFGSHIEHHLKMIKTTKSNSSLKKYLKELYPHQNTTDTDVIQTIVKWHKISIFCTKVTFDLNLHHFVVKIVAD